MEALRSLAWKRCCEAFFVQKDLVGVFWSGNLGSDAALRTSDELDACDLIFSPLTGGEVIAALRHPTDMLDPFTRCAPQYVTRHAPLKRGDTSQ